MIITLYTHEMQKTAAFYVDRLGFTIDRGNSDNNFMMLRPQQGPLLALESVAILPPGHVKEAGSGELGFEVENVDAIYEAWRNAGVTIVKAPEDHPFGREFLAKDPEGNYVSVFKLAGRPQ
jgi:predicted enzyme related to lactoylglutathione lyase